jgi:uncharacterized protein YbjT (DUF2867 family)
MKIAVFGATGGTGKIIVEKAVAAGHQVTALARNPSALPKTINVVQGEATDANAVEVALRGADAVLFAIGSGSMKPTRVRRDTARTVATTMKKLGIKRIVAMSGMGAGDSMDQMPWIMRKLVLPLIMKDLLEDQNGLEQAIKESGVEEWIIVRPGRLSDGASTGGKPSLSVKGVKSAVARVDVADFMLANLESREWVGKTPMIG